MLYPCFLDRAHMMWLSVNFKDFWNVTLCRKKNISLTLEESIWFRSDTTQKLHRFSSINQTSHTIPFESLQKGSSRINSKGCLIPTANSELHRTTTIWAANQKLLIPLISVDTGRHSHFGNSTGIQWLAESRHSGAFLCGVLPSHWACVGFSQLPPTQRYAC